MFIQFLVKKTKMIKGDEKYNDLFLVKKEIFMTSLEETVSKVKENEKVFIIEYVC